MNKPKFFIFAAIFLLSLSAVFAQADGKNQIEPSYEVYLHVIVASDQDDGKKDLPPTLAAVAKKLKSEYSYSNYRLAATFFERISLNGGVDHKGILNQLKQNGESATYFSEWMLNGLQTAVNARGQNIAHFQNFRFGARIPVVVRTIKNEKGDGEREIVNYESVGVGINRFNVPENTPTLIGSLTTPKTDEFVFLVLTVKPADF